MRTIPLMLACCCIAFYLTTCNQGVDNNASSTSTTASTASTSSDTPAGASDKKPIVLYSMVDDLIIREKPGDSGKMITKVDEGTPLAFRGEVSEFTTKKVIRGAEYNNPWMKVSTKDGKIGWVYGGAVSDKRMAAKGGASTSGDESASATPDAAPTSTPAKTTPAPKVNFAQFGSYDLSTWTKASSQKPDKYTTEERYTKDGMTMIIRKSDYGKTSYDYTCELYGPDNMLMKSHSLSIYEQSEEDRGLHLREEVLDFESNPPKSYSKYRGNNINVRDFDPKDLSATKKRGTLPGEFESSTIPQNEIEYRQKRLE